MPETATTEDPANNTDLVQAQITGLEAANGRLREVAKWFVTSAAALAALLVGTSPLSGLSSLGWTAELILPVVFGSIALIALGVVIFRTSRVLAPSVVDVSDLLTQGGKDEFSEFRVKVNLDPYNYFGAGATGLGDFAARRAREFAVLRSIDSSLSDPATSKADEKVLTKSRTVALGNITRTGWIVQRLVAIAENERLWSRFTSARLTVAICASVAVVGIVGFLVSVQSGASADDLTGPMPVKVALTDSGASQFRSALGTSCPTKSFEALLLKGGKTAPWEVMVTDARCTHVNFTLDADDGHVLFVPAQ